MDELADMIGVKPKILWLLITDPRLAFRVIFGPNVSYVYRIDGPHKWDGAREAILNVPMRVRFATAAKRRCKTISYNNFGQLIVLSFFLLVLILGAIYMF
jgi:dimethylaniline monooxygenase (N-oxide forming)